MEDRLPNYGSRRPSIFNPLLLPSTETNFWTFQYCADDIVPSTVETVASVYNLLIPSNCKKRKFVYDWTPGRWLEGQPRVPELTKAAVKNRWDNRSRIGLNLSKIEV